MAKYTSTFHMEVDDNVEMTGYSQNRGTWESNWVTIKMARGDMTVFFPSLTHMSAFALQLQAAVDLAVETRIKEAESVDDDDA